MAKKVKLYNLIGADRNEKDEKLIKDLGEAILKYVKNGKGKVYIDDAKLFLGTSRSGWVKVSLWFKVV